MNLGNKLFMKVLALKPVNSVPDLGSFKGFLSKGEKGMLKVATRRMARSPLLHRAKRPLPAKHSAVHKTRTTVAQRYSTQKPSGSQFDQLPDILPKFCFRQSIRPTALSPVLKTHPR